MVALLTKGNVLRSTAPGLYLVGSFHAQYLLLVCIFCVMLCYLTHFLLVTCISQAEEIVQRSIHEVDNPAISAVTCTPGM
jgi:hypothetical protein